MICNPLDTANPFLWLFLAGFFTGLGTGLLPFFYPRLHNPRRLTSGRWILISLFLSMAVFSFSGALFAPAGGLFSGNPVSFNFFKEPGWAAVLLIPLFLGGLACRFPRAAGIPVLLFLIITGAAGTLALRSWVCVKPAEAVLTLKVLSERKTPDTHGWISVVQIDFENGSTLLTTLEAKGIVPVVEQVIAPRSLFFLGTGRLYRIPSLHGAQIPNSSGTGEAVPGEIPFQYPGKDYHAGPDWLIKIADKVPFLHYFRGIPPGDPPEIGQTVRIILDGLGSVKMEPVYF